MVSELPLVTELTAWRSPAGRPFEEVSPPVSTGSMSWEQPARRKSNMIETS
jgi:hypothetical protein